MSTQNQAQDAYAGMSREELIARLTAKAVPTQNGLRVSAKGALSVYGLGRWPVTLYASQWRDLLAKREDILAFLDANASKLAVKPARGE